jgi:hypothetical protein
MEKSTSFTLFKEIDRTLLSSDCKEISCRSGECRVILNFDQVRFGMFDSAFLNIYRNGVISLAFNGSIYDERLISKFASELISALGADVDGNGHSDLEEMPLEQDISLSWFFKCDGDEYIMCNEETEADYLLSFCGEDNGTSFEITCMYMPNAWRNFCEIELTSRIDALMSGSAS